MPLLIAAVVLAFLGGFLLCLFHFLRLLIRRGVIAFGSVMFVSSWS
jgi:hypothetical protein